MWLAPKVNEKDIKIIVPIIEPISKKQIGVIDEHGNFIWFKK